MIKTKEVIEKIEERYCDECGKPASHQCHFCFKDLCNWQQNGCAIQDDRDECDRPDYYCKQCWEIGEPYRKKRAELEEEAWKQEEAWKKEAKKVAKSKPPKQKLR